MPASSSSCPEFFVPGRILWLYYPPAYRRRTVVLEEQRRAEAAERARVERRARGQSPAAAAHVAAMSNVEGAPSSQSNEVPASFAIPPPEDARTGNEDAARTGVADDAVDADDEDTANPFGVAAVGMDDMGVGREAEAVVRSAQAPDITSYSGGIFLEVCAPDDGAPTSPRARFFDRIVMTEWLFVDHTASSHESELDWLIRHLEIARYKAAATDEKR
jgi:hypothetical protein